MQSIKYVSPEVPLLRSIREKCEAAASAEEMWEYVNNKAKGACSVIVESFLIACIYIKKKGLPEADSCDNFFSAVEKSNADMIDAIAVFEMPDKYRERLLRYVSNRYDLALLYLDEYKGKQKITPPLAVLHHASQLSREGDGWYDSSQADAAAEQAVDKLLNNDEYPFLG